MEIIKINHKNPNSAIEKIADMIKDDKVAIFPTDTVYGLICDAANKKVVERIFKIKKWPREKPIAIFTKDIKMAKKFAKINKWQEKFLKNNKITGVFEARRRAKKLLSAGIISREGKIGIRIPNYKLIKILFKFLPFPLVQTSANISGKSAETKISKILKQFQNQKNQPDLAIDAGNLKASSPSAVIDLTGKIPIVLRK